MNTTVDVEVSSQPSGEETTDKEDVNTIAVGDAPTLAEKSLLPTTSAQKSQLPASSTMMSLSSSRIHTLDHQDRDSINYWAPAAEYNGRIIFLSHNDGRPRITNIDGGPVRGKGKLKVGDWSNLADPASHETRHIILANIRRSAPDRVCPNCSYLLTHSCPDSKGQKHCEECCHVPTPNPTDTYGKLGRGHRMFMEALLSLANSPDKPREKLPDADRYRALTTATRYGYGLYGPRESEEACKNERTWNRLKEEDPELAWGLYKNLNGVQDAGLQINLICRRLVYFAPLCRSCQ